MDQGPVMGRGRKVGQPRRAETSIQKVGHLTLQPFFSLKKGTRVRMWLLFKTKGFRPGATWGGLGYCLRGQGFWWTQKRAKNIFLSQNRGRSISQPSANPNEPGWTPPPGGYPRYLGGGCGGGGWPAGPTPDLKKKRDPKSGLPQGGQIAVEIDGRIAHY